MHQGTQKTLTYSVRYCTSGQGTEGLNLYDLAYEECSESHVWDKTLWLQGATGYTIEIDRYEVFAWDCDTVVGGVILAVDYDLHVGECLTVVFQYVHPQYRHRGISRQFLRTAMRVARELGLKTLAYTHRVGDGKYMTTYRRTRG